MSESLYSNCIRRFFLCYLLKNAFRDPCKTGIYGTFLRWAYARKRSFGEAKNSPNYLLCLRFFVLLRLELYPYLPVLQGSL